MRVPTKPWVGGSTPGPNRFLALGLTGAILAGVVFGERAQGQTRNPMKVTVDRAVEETVGRNLSLLAERYNVTLAEAQVVAARARPNPVLSVGGDHLDLLGTGFSEFNAAGPSEYSLRVDFPIERGDKRRLRIEVATHAKSVAEFGLQNATRLLVIDVQRSFVEMQAAKESLELARKNLETFNEVVEINSARVRAGDLAPIELVRTKIATVQLTHAVKQAEVRLKLARNKLQTVMGRGEIMDIFETEGPMRSDPLPPAFGRLLDKTLLARPDLLALREEQARTQADLRLQIAQRKVDYTVGTEYRRQQGLAGRGNSLGFFVSVPLPFFDRNQGGILRSETEGQQVEVRIKNLERDIRAELDATFLQCRNARELVESFEGGVIEQSKDVLDVTEYSYRRGEASFLEFLDAQRSYNETMQGYIDARADYARLRFELDAVTAGASV